MTARSAVLPLLLAALALAAAAPAPQREARAPERPAQVFPGRSVFRTYGRDQGFPSSAIHTLAQDEDGFLWMGTENGLFRYDGHATTRWGTADGLPSDWVLRLLPHPAGGFWVGTSLGLAHFRNGAATPVTVQGQPWKDHVSSLDLDGDGRLVVAGKGTVLRQTSETDLAPLPGCPEGPISQIMVARTGTLFIANNTCIHARRSDGTWIRYGKEDGLAFPPGPLQEDGEGNVWVANGRQLAVMRPGTGRFEDRSAWMPGAFYGGAATFADPGGNVWIPTLQGALRVRGTSHEVVGPLEGLPSRHVTGVFRDREQSLWLFASSLYRQLGQGAITAYTQQDGLPSDVVWSFFQDRTGTLWAGTGDGLARLGPGGWERIRGSEGMSILAIDQDAAGNLWLGNINGPPARLGADGSFTSLGASGVSSRARRVSVEGDGQVWFSLLGGQNMMRYEPRTHRLTPITAVYPEVAAIVPRALYRGAKGSVWVAGSSGIGCLKDAQWRFLNVEGGLRNAKVRGLALMDDGSAWAWYVEPHGITHLGLKDGRLVVLGHLDQSGGLASDLVYAASPGRDGTLWVTTDRGVNRLKDGAIRRFGIEEGLLTEDCSLNALAVDRDGDVWVGTSNGISRIRASRLPELHPLPPPRILRYDDGKGPHLAPFGPIPPVPHAAASLEFRFATPTYQDERNLRYEVRLVGLEEAWHPTEVRQARYPALPGGQYRFEVRVARAGSPFGPATALDFKVLPAWWHTWWFRALLGCAGLLLASLAVYARTAILHRRNRELESLVARRTAELREAKDQAERASAFKSVFLATTSHELRTPLNAILGFLRLMDRHEVPESERRRFLGTMRGAAESLLQLINDILDLERIEAGMLDLEPKPTDLREVAGRAMELLRFQAREKGLALDLDVDPELPRRIAVDPHRVQQMLVNLLGNALKFTHEGRVVCRIALAGREQDQALVRVSVEDTGEGVPADVLPRLFQPFSQGESRAKRQGSGLGLSITRRLAERMGGTVGAESTPGEGSRFWFTLSGEVLPETLPGEAAPGAPAGPASPEESPLKGRVLVADDNPANRMLAAAILDQLGLERTLVADGQEALEAFARAPFDLVILDGNMPRLDGVGALRALRATPEGRRVPILFFSATAQSTRTRALELGFDDVLSKPADMDDFLARLAEHLTRTPVAPQERVDGDRIQKLAEALGGPAELASFLEEFLADGRTRLNDLRSALSAQDRTRFERLAHDLKTNAGNFGLEQLVGLARDAEHAAAETPWSDLAQKTTDLEAAFQAAETLLLPYRTPSREAPWSGPA